MTRIVSTVVALSCVVVFDSGCGTGANEVAHGNVTIQWGTDIREVRFGAVGERSDGEIDVVMSDKPIYCNVQAKALQRATSDALVVRIRINEETGVFDPETVFVEREFPDSSQSYLGPGRVEVDRLDVELTGRLSYTRDIDEVGTVGAAGEFSIPVCSN